MARKEKAPKVKKEKKPKVKREKKPKVKKEKGAKGKGGKKKLLLILIPVVLAIGVLAFLFFTGKIGKKAPEPEDPPPEEELIEEPPAEEEPEEKEPEPTMTVDETVNYILSLSPSTLGLEGESMAEYTAHTTSGVYPVDGLLCTQVNVYKQNAVGTNDIQGCYLVSRGSIRRLYKLDPISKEVVELSTK